MSMTRGIAALSLVLLAGNAGAADRPVRPGAAARPARPSAGDRAGVVARTDPAGGWVKAGMYDLRVKSVVRCAAARGGAAAPGVAQGGQLGVELEIRSHVRPLFVASRDAALWDGGLMFPAARTGTVPGCQPALRPSNLGRGGRASGFVVFALPARTGALVLHYTPTRWGGSDRVQIPITPPR